MLLEDALELLDPIMELQAEVDKVNEEEYDRKFKIKEKCKETLRWDENLGCLRHPCITSSQKSLLQERSEIVKTLPRFWSTVLSADQGPLRYMNEEEQEIMLKYLKSVDVFYEDGEKSGFTIFLHMDINPYFGNSTLIRHSTSTVKESIVKEALQSGGRMRTLRFFLKRGARSRILTCLALGLANYCLGILCLR
ncbi:NAP1-related protein 2-like isoform X2 [Papaver somniferum]|uniref:NAP1-related protein 2-like isoform X2 n=1 Tax=Papaver somniferum TaxID=3469 RepID=UPI000E6F5280|nr:NAP1-related protein 2-like isoform X2 [Papaver somniferum]XP_026407474.1 NAP1-related protein 2-like isoform X2 [Papaver somniferum]